MLSIPATLCLFTPPAVIRFNENVERGICTQVEVDDGSCSLNTTVSSVTGRGFTYGEEYWGTFFRALYTLFQVLTGDSWAEGVARTAMFSVRDGVWSALYFTSFIIFTQIVLINVVVAVLLEKFVEDEEDAEATLSEKLNGAGRCSRLEV